MLSSELKTPDMLIGADIPLDAGRFPIRELLDAFRRASVQRPGLRLALTGQRCSNNDFLVWNYLDEHELVGEVDFLPHYGLCTEFPAKKQDCAVWVSRHMPASALTPENLLREPDMRSDSLDKVALFVTSFHPAKHEGNSAVMRQWLQYLRSAGYRVHVVYYATDEKDVTDDMRQALRRDHELVMEVPVTTKSVNRNANGLNVHVDDWCGVELLDVVGELAAESEYDVAVVNYAFMSAAFERVAAYTRKVLLTHDSFENRNRRMLAEGFPEAGWVSLDQLGEGRAFRRADIVVALQDGEASKFRGLAGPGVDVRVIGPIPPAPRARRPKPAKKLRIGYCGSANFVNEFNLAGYLTELAKLADVVAGVEMVVAGGVSLTLQRFASPELLAGLTLRLLGPIDPLYQFYEQCDICINPETGGSGIKIKTLDALAHGVPIITTMAGAAGIMSTTRFHAASDAAALVRLTAELLADRDLLETVRQECHDAYAAYVARNSCGMAELLGPMTRPPPRPPSRCAAEPREMVVPEFVGRVAAPYHLDEFRKVFSRIDISAKRVLEIGSDYHLACARLFAANGAAEVVANNIWEWRSAEPLPPNIRFCVGDICDVDLPEHCFDIVYGIAILEHVKDPDRVAQTVKRVLRPDGIAYLQGCPLWTGHLGHQVWVERHQIGANGEDEGVVYSFADPTKNPIPNWAHLTHGPYELRAMLVANQLPAAHAEAIVRFVYNLDGTMTGSCSNFKAPSQIVTAFREYFDVESEVAHYQEPEDPEFRKALEHYSEADLSTIGLTLWLTHKRASSLEPLLETTPAVSIIIPFYNVEAFIAECLASVLTQDLSDFDVILIDDQSRDGSRQIADRFAQSDSRIRIVTHAENRGLGRARNTGVRYAAGKYILFLDSDDRLSGPDALRKLVEAARETGWRVVIGSSAWLKPDGSIADFDRQRDRESDGQPGTVKHGLDAFLGSLGLPGHSYLPPRSWGTLIQRDYWEELGLDYPPGEHEDMPHFPFLYYRAGGVYYHPHVAVLYRERSDGLSMTAWSAAKCRRYACLWQEMKRRMHSQGLQEQVGDVAAVFACHVMWRIGLSGTTADAGDTPAQMLQAILADTTGARSRQLLFQILGELPKQPWSCMRDFSRYEIMTSGIPSRAIIEFHREKLGLGQTEPDLDQISIFDSVAPDLTAKAVGGAPTVRNRTDAFEANAARETEILAGYEEAASDRLKNLPAMLTYGDKAIYFHAGQTFTFRGSIVDGGCFAGGSTLALLEGLRRNPLMQSRNAETRGLIRVYDLFTVDDDYVLKHLRESYPDREFQPRTSFLPMFEENLRAEWEKLRVRVGDVTAIGYPDAEPIELFGVDFCKALPITDFVVRCFFPRLLSGALVLQRDFGHEYHPHIHLSMLRLADHFENYVELRSGGTFAYTCLKPITAAVVHERFGSDASWFTDAATNAPLLRRLIEECHYDENRWVFLLTLGMYYLTLGRANDAHAVYREAREQFPQFVPNDLTRRMLGD